ncbi:MAG: GTPase Era, partial [Alphaproteobacteria bacterium]|nr:GTPase Era [Alphaproteobacteria bacterium]
QIVFVDTPGIFTPKKRLERAIVAAAWEGDADADLTLLLVDASRGKANAETHAIIEKLATQKGKRVVLVLNKIDQIAAERLLALSAKLNETMGFVATFMISAKTGSGTKDLMGWLANHLPKGPFLFPADEISDMPVRLLAAEITREKLFHKLHDELPYALSVETEGWEDFKNGSVKLDQTIYVARESHKAIILGKGGQQIKKIGEEARKELEDILETRVHLKLFVKVRENWADDPERYRLWGLDPSA